jgi:light-regulated signal transduction histidine kinase (bacteriophytochrome)
MEHDLRSALGAISNFASVLEEDHREALGEEARTIVARIRRAASTAFAVLDGMARLARVGAGDLCFERVDLAMLVRGVFAELRAERPRVELVVGELPMAAADARLLRVAVGELLSNAIKFSERCEKPRIEVGGRRERDGTLVYWVVDQGVGFEMRFANRLFGAYERLHSRDEFPGAGVGLAIVRRVMERHGGRTWAEAELGHGARFYFSLPGRTEVTG